MPVPHIVGLMVAAAGVYAGVRLIISNIQRALEETERTHADAEKSVPDAPRDQGTLEWDETAGVYRPARRV